MDAPDLLNPERRLLSMMLDDPGRSLSGYTMEETLHMCNWNDQAIAIGAAYGLQNHGLVEVLETHSNTYTLDHLGEEALESGLLEQRLWTWMCEQDSPSMADLQKAFERHEAGPGIGLLKKLGVSLSDGLLTAASPDAVSEVIETRVDFLQFLKDGITDELLLDWEVVPDDGPIGYAPDLIEYFSSRAGFVKRLERTERVFVLTEKGNEYPRESLEYVSIVSEITPEFLQKDGWKNAEFRAFDVTLEATTPRTGRSHPMQALIERIRSVFLEMGFSELVDDYVQSAGWNMDALFIPQDHPAREMQDTFYLDEPASINLDEDVMQLWKNIHEHGGETGSTGWGGSYSTDVSKRALLRTHTTVNTIQYLAEHPKEACRVFSVDRVFRKEAIDRTHLPEFHQIEGIIMEEGANLQMLVTTLKTFYTKMGYPEVRVRPAYFPYTEPSLEIEVKWRGKWLELGGAGIFRPEVTEPLGITSPVLAWGMGLERLAMLVLGLDDIRQLYISDLEWLRQQPIL